MQLAAGLRHPASANGKRAIASSIAPDQKQGKPCIAPLRLDLVYLQQLRSGRWEGSVLLPVLSPEHSHAPANHDVKAEERRVRCAAHRPLRGAAPHSVDDGGPAPDAPPAASELRRRAPEQLEAQRVPTNKHSMAVHEATFECFVAHLNELVERVGYVAPGTPLPDSVQAPVRRRSACPIPTLVTHASLARMPAPNPSSRGTLLPPMSPCSLSLSL